jgi:predicted Zn-dependent protease
MQLKPWLVPTVAVLLAACATNPATGRRQLMLMSEAEEIQLGREADAQVRSQMGLYEDAALQRYVSDTGLRLARLSERPELPWSFAVVDAPAVNAFALPGGFIYLTRGMLPFLQDESELAAVLGHEIGHVTARHSAAAYSRQMALGGGLGVLGVLVPETQPLQGLAGVGLQLLFLQHSREAELEADGLGTGYTASGGWDPQGMPDLLSTLGRLDEASGSRRGVPNWAATHPHPDDRVERVQQAVDEARALGGTTVDRAGFERQLEGVVYGDSRESGLVRGDAFVHPILRFGVNFPSGWEIANSPEQVVARPPEDAQAAMVLELAPSGGSVEQVARTQMADAGFREVSGERAEINGLPAYVGVYEGVLNNSRIGVRAAHIRNLERTYLLAGVAPPGSFSQADRVFVDAIGSFRTLSQREADAIQPHRIGFYSVRRGDTWESLARTVSPGVSGPATLAIMNGVSASTPPQPGDRIRVVAGG